MSRTGWSPTGIPCGADQTVYLVIDRFSSGTVYRETEIERADLETIISDSMTGQFNDPVRVVAFNTSGRRIGPCVGYKGSKSRSRRSSSPLSVARPSPRRALARMVECAGVEAKLGIKAHPIRSGTPAASPWPTRAPRKKRSCAFLSGWSRSQITSAITLAR